MFHLAYRVTADGSQKSNRSYREIKTVELSTEARNALQNAKTEIESYDESELPLQEKTQMIETLRHYATCDFISRKLDAGEQSDKIKDMEVDKSAVDIALETVQYVIFCRNFQQ